MNRLIEAQKKGPWDYASTIAVVLTLVVLVWYTYETYRLRKAAQEQTEKTAELLITSQVQNTLAANLWAEAQRQNESTARLVEEAQRQNDIPLMPILTICVVSPGQSPAHATREIERPQMIMRNVGSGPALNVSIDEHAAEGCILQFQPGTNMMTPGETRVLSYYSYYNDIGVPGYLDGICNLIEKGHIPNPLTITVRCHSAASKAYKFTFAFSFSDGIMEAGFIGVEPDLLSRKW